jgi:hypothetical protein
MRWVCDFKSLANAAQPHVVQTNKPRHDTPYGPGFIPDIHGDERRLVPSQEISEVTLKP